MSADQGRKGPYAPRADELAPRQAAGAVVTMAIVVVPPGLTSLAVAVGETHREA